MIYNEETIQLEELLENLMIQIKQTSEFKAYKCAKNQLENKEIIVLKHRFQQTKDAYEFQEHLGKYAPKLKEKRKEMIQAKRALDLHPDMILFRKCEANLQQMLDSIVETIAKTVDNDIMIEFGNPLNKKSCGGNCHE